MVANSQGSCAGTSAGSPDDCYDQCRFADLVSNIQECGAEFSHRTHSSPYQKPE
jgi:hypothetical protein